MTDEQLKEIYVAKTGYNYCTNLDVVAMKEAIRMATKELNQFISDIAKLLGEDDLGFDGKSWTIDDFKNGIESEAKEYGHWLLNKFALGYKMAEIPEPEATELYQQFKSQQK